MIIAFLGLSKTINFNTSKRNSNDSTECTRKAIHSFNIKLKPLLNILLYNKDCVTSHYKKNSENGRQNTVIPLMHHFDQIENKVRMQHQILKEKLLILKH